MSFTPSADELSQWNISRASWNAFPRTIRRQVGDETSSARRFAKLTELMAVHDPEEWEHQPYRPSPVDDPAHFQHQQVYTTATYQGVGAIRQAIPVNEDDDGVREIDTMTPTQLDRHGANRRIVELAFIPAHESAIQLHEGGVFNNPSMRTLEGIAVQQHYHAWNRGEDADQCIECEHGARFSVCRNLWIAPPATDDAYDDLDFYEGQWYRYGACASCIARGLDCSLARYKEQCEAYQLALADYRKAKAAASARGERAKQDFLDNNRHPQKDLNNTTEWNYEIDSVPPECELKTGP